MSRRVCVLWLRVYDGLRHHQDGSVGLGGRRARWTTTSCCRRTLRRWNRDRPAGGTGCTWRNVGRCIVSNWNGAGIEPSVRMRGEKCGKNAR